MPPALAATAKYGPAIAAPIVAQLVVGMPFDTWWLLFIPVGLMLGWMARAGRMVEDKKPLGEIVRDLGVSVLIGGFNAAATAVAIWTFRMNYLAGTTTAIVFAFGGVRTINSHISKLRPPWSSEDPGEARQAEQRVRSLDALADDRDLDRLAKRLDEIKKNNP